MSKVLNNRILQVLLVISAAAMGCTEINDRSYFAEATLACSESGVAATTGLEWDPESGSREGCLMGATCVNVQDCKAALGEEGRYLCVKGQCFNDACQGGDGCCPERCRPAGTITDADPATVDAECGIVDLLESMTCMDCHSSSKGNVLANLDFDTLPDVLPTGEISASENVPIIAPCEPDRSLLIYKTSTACEVSVGTKMPPAGGVGQENDVLLLQQWILEGASQPNVDCPGN